MSKNTTENQPAVSVVVPVYNEEENVTILYDRITAAMH